MSALTLLVLMTYLVLPAGSPRSAAAPSLLSYSPAPSPVATVVVPLGGQGRDKRRRQSTRRRWNRWNRLRRIFSRRDADVCSQRHRDDGQGRDNLRRDAGERWRCRGHHLRPVFAPPTPLGGPGGEARHHVHRAAGMLV